MRSDSLLQTGDTRDIIHGMISYRFAERNNTFETRYFRFYYEQITSMKPMDLMNYGCQCQLMSESSFGQSKDELDKACIAWHQCRKCVSIDQDLLLDDRNCDPKHDLYQIGVNTETDELSCDLSSE